MLYLNKWNWTKNIVGSFPGAEIRALPIIYPIIQSFMLQFYNLAAVALWKLFALIEFSMRPL